MVRFAVVPVLTVVLSTTTHGFITPRHNHHIQQQILQSSERLSLPLFAERDSDSTAGKGFGDTSKEFVDKSYGDGGRPSTSDDIDVETAMSSFFESKEEWLPLFRCMSASTSPPASSHLSGGPIGSPIEFLESAPWKQLPALPTNDDELAAVSNFLDVMQQSLVEIPVNEYVEEDASDVHFIEEGRRILAIARFHVPIGSKGGHDELFKTCWSEMAELRRSDAEGTGSIIILPDYEMADLRQFAENNLHMPLDWLGVAHDFEVSSLERGVPAVRILYKLGGIPIPETDEDDEDVGVEILHSRTNTQQEPTDSTPLR